MTPILLDRLIAGTRLFYLKVKPGFGYSDFISIQQVFMKGTSLLMLRTSLDEEESPHKYIYPEEKFVTLRRGYMHFDCFNFSHIDNMTCQLEHFYCVDYGLGTEYDEVNRVISKDMLKVVKSIKEVCEKKSLENRVIY